MTDDTLQEKFKDMRRTGKALWALVFVAAICATAVVTYSIVPSDGGGNGDSVWQAEVLERRIVLLEEQSDNREAIADLAGQLSRQEEAIAELAARMEADEPVAEEPAPEISEEKTPSPDDVYPDFSGPAPDSDELLLSLLFMMALSGMVDDPYYGSVGPGYGYDCYSGCPYYEDDYGYRDDGCDYAYGYKECPEVPYDYEYDYQDYPESPYEYDDTTPLDYPSPSEEDFMSFLDFLGLIGELEQEFGN